MILTYRERELVRRGYDEKTVEKLVSFDMDYAYEVRDIIENDITENCFPNNEPVAIYVGGQPGTGKTTALRAIKKDWEDNNVICIVGLDNYRIYHPNYELMEKEINDMWKDKSESSIESKGNDIADFTSNFAGIVSDLLIEDLSNKKFNIAIEWGMRNPNVPLKTMETLKEKGYKNKVEFIVVDKETSKEACKIRDEVMSKHDILTRRIPDYFHDDAVNTLPASAEQIYIEGFVNKKFIDEFLLIDRDGNILWDSNSKDKLIDTYNYYLNNKNKEIKNNPSLGEISYIEETKKIEAS